MMPSGKSPSSHLRSVARLIALCAGFAGASLMAVAQDTPVEDMWSAKVPEFRAGEIEGRQVILYFTATWCGYCVQMERTTLANPNVRSRLEAFSKVRIDFDQQPELVARYQIRGVPAFVMVDAGGGEIARLVGATEADPFRGWLEDSQKRAVELAKAAKQRRLEVERLTTLLNSGGAGVWEGVRVRLYELAARGETGAKAFALARITERAHAAPLDVFDGLLHPDLAVRLTIAGVLRKKLGERFVFDPWADANERGKAVDKLVAAIGS